MIARRPGAPCSCAPEKTGYMQLRAQDIIEAGGGRLLQGSAQAEICGVSIDSRRMTEKGLFIPLPGTQCDGHGFIADAFHNGASASLVRAGHAASIDDHPAAGRWTLIEVADPLTALGDIASCWRGRCTARVVAVTGSNGKTSTKELAWSIVSRRFSAIRNPGNWNNLIGLPLTLLTLTSDHEIALLEMGMSDRGEIRRLAEISRPRIGLITNIGPAHLEQLKTLDNIMEAKAELTDALGSGDIAILNQDDARVASLAARTRAQVITYGIAEGDVRARAIREKDCTGTSFTLALSGRNVPVQLNIPGTQYVSNALAAASIGLALGIDPETIAAGISSFSGVPGRMQTELFGDIAVINDAYNANPVSMRSSLETLSALRTPGKKIAVLGDMLELGETAECLHRDLGRTIAGLHIDYLFLKGDFAQSVRTGAADTGFPEDRIVLGQSTEDLSSQLMSTVGREDVILIKGSRKMKMEKIADELRRRFG